MKNFLPKMTKNW